MAEVLRQGGRGREAMERWPASCSLALGYESWTAQLSTGAGSADS